MLRIGGFEVDEADLQKFAEEFLNEYLSQGFGSMTKRNIDILVLHLIIKHLAKGKEIDLYELSKALKIPKKKLEGIYLECRIRYPQESEEDLKNFLKRVVKENEYEFDEGSKKIQFSVDDPYIRERLEEILRKEGIIVDYSFNRGVLKITVGGFLRIVKGLFEEDWEEKIDDIIDNIMKNKDLETIIIDENLKTKFEKFKSDKNIQNFFELISAIAVKIGNSKLLQSVLKLLI